MKPDQLDDRIRDLVSAAVSTAPEPRPFDQIGISTVQPITSTPRRRWVPAAVVVVTAAAAAVGVFMVRSAEPAAPVVVPGTQIGTVASTVPATAVLPAVVDSSLPGATVPQTTDALAPTATPTTALPVRAVQRIVSVSSGGVWEYAAIRCSNGAGCPLAAEGKWGIDPATPGVQWSSEPMERAFKAADGSMIVQRAQDGSANGTSAAIVPMRIATPMAPPVPLSTLLEPGWYTLHDVNRLDDGRELALVEWRSPEPDDPQNGVYHTSRLLAVDLKSGAVLTVVDQFLGFEEWSTRMHLASTGLVVGERGSTSDSGLMVVAPSWLSPAPALVTAADLGLRDGYSFCSPLCPATYAIDKQGTAIAWVDSGTLWVKPITGANRDAKKVALPFANELFQVTDIDLNGPMATVTGHQSKSETSGSFLVTLDPAASVDVGEGASLTLVP